MTSSKYHTILAIYEGLKRFNEALRGFIEAMTGLAKTSLDLLP